MSALRTRLSTLVATNNYYKVGLAKWLTAMPMRKQKRWHCNSVSFSLSGSLTRLSTLVATNNYYKVGLAKWLTAMPMRKQKRWHCNSVSFSLSGSLWQSSDVQFGFFFLSRFGQFYQQDFIWALVLFSSYLFIFETYIYIFNWWKSDHWCRWNWMTSKVWGKILNLIKCNIVSFQGHIVSQKCL